MQAGLTAGEADVVRLGGAAESAEAESAAARARLDKAAALNAEQVHSRSCQPLAAPWQRLTFTSAALVRLNCVRAAKRKYWLGSMAAKLPREQ